MDLTIHASFLPYEDPEASLASWRDALGFEVRNDVDYGGLRWITVGPAGQPGTSIVLQPPAPPGCGVTDQERRTIVEMMAKGTCAGVNLATKELDGVFERLQAGGAPGGPGNPPHPSRARRRSVIPPRSRTTRRPAERSSGSRQAHSGTSFIARGRSSNGRSEHEANPKREANSKDEANAEVEANAEEMTTTHERHQPQSNQKGQLQ